ncbi:hypothetical protein WG622_18040 [Cognatishimia sp. D5M38]|uniref:Uncharacterized protein n=1 Tax=Cognatishimia coralii TaxID=3083254 RepID=A0ABU8QL49_9RHOB|nr:hypothetical protein [Donghicola eburneus]MCI5040727.1 hypothetical protein [Donghicola eburneus]
MVAFAFTVETECGPVTVHTDELEQFLTGFEVDVATRPPATLIDKDQTFHLPYLIGYKGPLLMGRCANGDRAIGYEERV